MARAATPAPAKTSDAPAEPPGEPPPASEAPEPITQRRGDSPVDGRLRALEERLGQITRAETATEIEPAPASIREHVSSAAREVVDRLAAPMSRVDETNVVDAVRDLLSSDYYLRQWGRLGMRNRSEEVDDFGLDPVYEARLKPIADFLYERYFRVDAEGIENIPATGRCLVVANHSGTLPLDGLMLRTCVRRAHPGARELRWLAEDFVYYLPFVGAFMSRVGGVRACPENAERLLGKESLVAVFPEGVKGIGKLYRDRYQLQRFGRGGFIRLCLRTGTPLVPCAVIGAEEASPMLHRDELVSKLLGLPYLPVTPTFPLLGPLGLIPAPTKWRLRFGELVRFDEYGPDAAQDPVLVGRLADRVRAGIQQMLDGGLAERRSIWFG
jgi:1-acyl-sn-glycerol-3-phosphate acyltransferase